MAQRRYRDPDDAFCKHGIDKRFPCGSCRSDRDIEQKVVLGKLNTLPYREARAEEFGLELVNPPTVKHRCEFCKRRGAVKGNRIYLRLPRLRESFGKGPRIDPPTWDGPVSVHPKIFWASHRRNGHWICDRCDPKHAVGAAEEGPVSLDSLV